MSAGFVTFTLLLLILAIANILEINVIGVEETMVHGQTPAVRILTYFLAA